MARRGWLQSAYGRRGHIFATGLAGLGVMRRRKTVGALDVQNQTIGWLRKGCSSLGGETVVRFP